MDRFDRIFELNRILQASRHPVSRKRLEDELECSRATVKRIIEDMRLYLNAPIVYDREHNGYCYDQREGQMYELPGLWFNASELHALLTVQQLLADVQPGLLEPMLKPLQQRIDALLELQRTGSEGLVGRIRMLQMAARHNAEQGGAFQTVAGALAQRKRLRLKYYSRWRESRDERDVSPQRLVHYRDNWYLDGWCHLREGLRTFALDAIEQAVALDEPALDVDAAALDSHFASSYGIFAGTPQHEAVLCFSATRARYVANERWHRDQQGRPLDDGRYELRVPYSNPAELIMDILKFGPEVEVIAPVGLREAVAERLREALDLYGAPAESTITPVVGDAA
ncbi:YafY family protein [Thiohalocapsa sp. ML1]|jgi:proteasome accessory factor C|uniref:helix-turn-helix transcriptional regulator n=1 Tax=Thiohalocapsa sp. ML1 TaxID=1431688 RepID=UPI000732297D|nr:WYL domain-containing protein [Thiohalocapsa sp. ML1]